MGRCAAGGAQAEAAGCALTRHRSTIRADVEVFDAKGRRLRLGDIVTFPRGGGRVVGRLVGWKRNGEVWVEYTTPSGKSVRAARTPLGVELLVGAQLRLFPGGAW